MGQELETFAALARTYCDWAESSVQDPIAEVRLALSHLSRLYSAVLELPQVFGEEDTPAISNEDWQRVFQRFEGLPFSYYSSCFDPQILPGEDPVVSDVADDLADIWSDLKGGLALYDAGHLAAASHEWRFHFYIHWGKHATGAMYALHCWLEKNHDLY